MRKEIWKILKSLENGKVTTNGAYHLLCDLFAVSGRSEQLVCDKCGYPMFYHKPDDIMYCHGCENTKPAN